MCIQWLINIIGNYFKIYLILNIFLISIIDSYHLTTKKACGTANTINFIDRIVGGYDIGYYKYPWFAALEHTEYKEFLCGGSLISSRHVVTAAHCITTFSQMIPENIYNVHLGITNICNDTNIDKNIRKVFSTSRVIVHENYRTYSFLYDIAILFLNATVYNFTPICLPLFGDDIITPEGTIIGLGLIEADTKNSTCSLQEARILKYSPKICFDMILSHQIPVNRGDMNKILCAGYLEGKIDACQGDSGGPFQIIGPHNKVTLEGIIAYGFGCAEKGNLGIYTNVKHFVPWIKSKIEFGRTKSPLPPFHHPPPHFDYIPKWWYYLANRYFSKYKL